MVAPFGVTILKYTVTISTFHFYLTINTRTFPSFNIIFNRFHKTLVWEKRQNGMWGQGKIRYRTWPLLPVVMDGWNYPTGKSCNMVVVRLRRHYRRKTMRITFSIPFPKKADCAMLTHSGDGGAPLGAGRGFVMTAEGPTLTGFNSAYRTSSTSDTVSMNYSWWAVGE